LKKRIFSILFALVLVLTLVTAGPVSANKTTFTTEYNQTQFQWRAWEEFGDWSSVYQNYASTSDFRLTGNVLHSAYSYSPAVSDLEGESTVYTYNKKTELWIEKEGTVSYRYEPYYGDYPIANYWRGYLNFGGETPSAESFVHGVAYQWAYLLAPQEVTPLLEYALWDETMDAWLVGFSIYLWDSETQAYEVEFPEPFIKPVPASNYNPLEL